MRLRGLALAFAAAHAVAAGPALLVASAVPARAADPVELRFGFPAPAASFVNTRGFTPWIEDVEKAAAGALKIKLFPGPTLGDFRSIYDRTLDGVADIAFGTFGPLGGQFKQTSVSALPFEARTTTEAALAQWRLYQAGVIAGEFDKVKVLSLFNFPAAHVHTKSPLKAFSLKGVKFSVSTKEEARLVAGMDGIPISMTPADVYEALSRGTTEGVVIAWTAVQTFKLHEVAKHHVEAGLGMGPAFVFMNKAAYAKLPAQAKAAIDRHSGEPFVRRMSAVIDEVAAGIAGQVAAMPGQHVGKLPDDQAAQWRERVKPIVDAWVAETPDGAKVLAAFRQEVQNVRQGR
jgi:TRAP-type C4-dicarboxylate transport system substrate-binding protein